MPRPRWTARATVPLALCVAATTAACGGGTEEPSPSAAPASSVSPSPSPITGAPAVVGTFRACHKLHDDSLVLVLRFQNRDPSLLGGYEGAIRIETTPVDPATWPTTGDPVLIPVRDTSFYELHRRIIVPPGEPAPSVLTLSVTTTPEDDPQTVLATNETTISVPATACAAS